jgi:peptidyl-prolyl cis-trans isomerase D
MLDALRRGAQGWLAKALFAVLIISFGIFWNVADVFRGFGRGSIAHVGPTDITVTEFQREFQGLVRNVSERSGSRLTNEQALLFRLDRQALEQLVARAAVKTHADELGLALSDATLAELLRNDPDFAGPDGKFSKLQFDGLLRQIGMTEHQFLALKREDELRREVTEAMSSAIVVPTPFVDDLNSWREETRTLEHVEIPASKVTVAEPDDAKLKDAYETNKAKFFTPEYRKLAVLLLTPDELKKDVTISDDELKTAYTETKESYDQPEQRRLQQIAFKDKASAEAARKDIVDGKKNFMDVAKEQGATESDVNLGMLTKKQLIDPKIANAAFSLERDKLSDVIDGSFATVLVRAIEIVPGKESTFDGVKDQVRDKLAKQKALSHIQERYDLVEEGRNAGKTLKEIAAEQKLRFIEVDAVDESNKTPDGKTGIDYADAADLLKEAFQTSPGMAHDAVELPSDSYGWFDVISVTEKKQKDFDAVKAEVKTLYMDEERSRLLNEFAQKLVDRLKGGEAFAKVAADAGGKPEETDMLKRAMSPPGLTTDAIKQAFGLPKGGAGYAETSDRAGRVLFQVKEINPAPAPSTDQSDKLAKELKQQLEGDYLLAYIAALKSDLSVRVNEEELKRATGVTTDSQQ